MTQYDIDKINSIDIECWMDTNGYKRGRGNSGKWKSYYSPFGSEGNASFKVDTSKNKWLDFSAGVTRRKSIIDLVMMIEKCDFRKACDILSGGNNIEIKHFEPKKQESGTIVHSIAKPSDNGLISMMVDVRKIDYDLVMKYCNEIVISFPLGKSPEVSYKAIGMSNDMGGIDIRSTESWMKLSTAPKCFTTIKGESDDACMVFEGFLDFLSYLTIYGLEIPEYTAYILNGLGMMNVLLPMIKHKEIHYWLDNDKPSDNLLEEMKGLNVIDKRYIFAFYKDVNEMLQDTSPC